jgi:hypothetical protein
MRERTKTVTIDDTEYQIRRFSPAVGSFILGRVLSAGARAMRDATERNGNHEAQPVQEGKEFDPKDAEPAARAMAVAAVLQGTFSIEDHSLIQTECMKVCSRMEENDKGSFPMPLVNDKGQWAIPELREDVNTAIQLEVEVLTFNFTDFFALGGLTRLVTAAVQRA